MIINQKKLKRQEEIVDKWVRQGAKGTIEACTGFGKTFTAILGVKRFRKKYPLEPINVVVPSIDLKSQWEQVLKNNNIEYTTVWVVNTYIRYKHQAALLICDECHRFLSDEFSKVFEYTDYKLLLCLSATLERNDGRHSILEELAPIVDRVSLEEAKKEGYVSDYTVYNLGLTFNDQDRTDYNKYHSTFNNNFAYFQRDFNLAMLMARSDKAYISTIDERGINVRRSIAEVRHQWATQQGWTGTDYIDGAGDVGANYYHPKTIKLKALQWLQSMHSRKKMIYKATSKIDAIKDIIKKFPDKKVIIFAEDSEFADKVSEALGSNCKSFHTKLKSEKREVRTETITKTGKVNIKYKTVTFGLKRLREEIIEDFKQAKFNVLSVVKALDEGFDDEDVDMVIMASYNSSKRQNTQRTGRGIRVKEGKHSLVINLYMVDSQEEKWLKSKQVGAKVSWVTTVDEIHDISSFSLV